MFKKIETYWSKLDREIIGIKLDDIRFKNKLENLVWSENQEKLRKEISVGKYDPTKGDHQILISGDGVCLDGHHRLYSLIETYSNDHVVEVCRLKTKYYYFLFMVIITLIIKPSLFD